MAKIKFGMMMTDARGKLGGQVFSKNRGGAYVRTKVTPSNPRTLTQMESRSALGVTSSAWNGLTDSQRASWNSAVDEFKRTDIFGDLKTPSGKNLFVRLNKNLLGVGALIIDNAPVKVEIPAMNATAVTFDPGVGTVNFANFLSVPAGMHLQVSATPILSAGISYVKNKLRVIDIQNAGAITPATIGAAYLARFGTPDLGANVYFQIRLIADNGQAGVPLLFKANVT